MNFKTIILSFFLIFVCNLSYAQVSTYTFIDPCTKEVSVFSVPIQGGKTMIIFLDNVGYFDANDLSNGTFTNWVNQTYTKYRQTNPCSQQQGQVTQNQITAQIIGGTIQSVVSSILSSSQAQSTSVENGSSSSDAGGKDNKRRIIIHLKLMEIIHLNQIQRVILQLKIADNPSQLQESITQMEEVVQLKEMEIQRMVEGHQVQVTQLKGEIHRLNRL